MSQANDLVPDAEHMVCMELSNGSVVRVAKYITSRELAEIEKYTDHMIAVLQKRDSGVVP